MKNIQISSLPVKCATTAACFAAAACWAELFEEYSFAAFVVITAEEVPVEEEIVTGVAEGAFVDFIIPPPPPTLVPSSWYMPPDIVVHVKGRIRAGTHIDARRWRVSNGYFDIFLNETFVVYYFR